MEVAAGLCVWVVLYRWRIGPIANTHQWCVCGTVVQLVLDSLKFLLNCV